MKIARIKNDGELLIRGEIIEYPISSHINKTRDIYINEIIEGIPTTLNPTSIPNCELWLDANTIDANEDDEVSLWQDGSVNQNNAEYAIGKPLYKSTGINGMPSLYFTDNRQLRHSPVLPSGATDYTLFYLIYPLQIENNGLTYFHAGNINAGDLGVFAENRIRECGFGNTSSGGGGADGFK